MFKSKFVMKQVDKGLIPLKKSLQTIKESPSYTKIGILGDSKKNRRRDGALTNVEIGIVHEFGSPAAGIPERSFIRSTMQAKRPAHAALLKVLLKKLYRQEIDVKTVLNILGMQAAADVKARIAEGSGIPPPNTPEVFMRKLLKNKSAVRNFNRTGVAPRPLVDTGQLLSSITWAVVMKGTKEEGKE